MNIYKHDRPGPEPLPHLVRVRVRSIPKPFERLGASELHYVSVAIGASVEGMHYYSCDFESVAS